MKINNENKRLVEMYLKDKGIELIGEDKDYIIIFESISFTMWNLERAKKQLSRAVNQAFKNEFSTMKKWKFKFNLMMFKRTL